ncbi:MAG TPA: NAD(P)H-dependent oxidoreductase subunit E, partial [Armatimonadota bacterium]|nr:NAD(P)H-dependent oxidoreductase subunit E [Armatimonadota bacterium]
MTSGQAQAATDPAVIDLREVDEIVERIGRQPEAVIPILQAIQARYRYLPREALRRVCQISEITPRQIAGVSTFYTQFRHSPVGEHTISVCHGTACHVKGAEQVTAALRRHLRIVADKDTDPQGLFTIDRVNCLGCCTLAPVMQIDGITYGHLSPDTVGDAVADFLELKRQGLVRPAVGAREQATDGLAEIRIGIGSCCVAGGSMQVRTALERAVRDYGAPAVVKPVGCVGMCHRTPLVEVCMPGQEPRLYAKVTADQAEGIIRQHFEPDGAGRRVLTALATAVDSLLDDRTREPVTRYSLDVRDAPVCDFLGPQRRIATEFSGALDPFDLGEYLDHGGFEALRTCLTERAPEQVIADISASGLRGRGGAGFP